MSDKPTDFKTKCLKGRTVRVSQYWHLTTVFWEVEVLTSESWLLLHRENHLLLDDKIFELPPRSPERREAFRKRAEEVSHLFEEGSERCFKKAEEVLVEPPVDYYEALLKEQKETNRLLSRLLTSFEHRIGRAP